MAYNMEITVTNTTPDITVDSSHPAVIYVGAGTSLPNQLQIQITNISGGDLNLWNAARGVGALIELDFVLLLSPGNVSGIQFSQPDWTLTPPAAPGPAGDRKIGLRYTGAAQTWADGASLEFTLTNVIASETHESPQRLDLDVDDVAGLSLTRYRQPKVAVLDAPVAGDQSLDMLCEFEPSDAVVFITARAEYSISNTLKLLLDSGGTAIPATPNETYITVCFDCGDGMGDLVPCTDLDNPTLNILRDYGNNWQSQDFPDAADPYWKFTANTSTLFQSGSNSKVELQLDNIVTQLEAGVANVYIQFGNVPGYRDRVCLETISKEVASPHITESLSANKSAVFPGEPVELAWEAVGTEYCSLHTGSGPVPGANKLLAKGSFTVYPMQNTDYNLQAHTGDDFIQSSITIYTWPFEIQSSNVPALPAVAPVTMLDDKVYHISSGRIVDQGGSSICSNSDSIHVYEMIVCPDKARIFAVGAQSDQLGIAVFHVSGTADNTMTWYSTGVEVSDGHPRIATSPDFCQTYVIDQYRLVSANLLLAPGDEEAITTYTFPENYAPCISVSPGGVLLYLITASKYFKIVNTQRLQNVPAGHPEYAIGDIGTQAYVDLDVGNDFRIVFNEDGSQINLDGQICISTTEAFDLPSVTTFDLSSGLAMLWAADEAAYCRLFANGNQIGGDQPTETTSSGAAVGSNTLVAYQTGAGKPMLCSAPQFLFVIPNIASFGYADSESADVPNVLLAWETTQAIYCQILADGTILLDQLPVNATQRAVDLLQANSIQLVACIDGKRSARSDLVLDPTIDSFGYAEGASKVVRADKPEVSLAWQTTHAAYCQIIADGEVLLDQLPTATDNQPVDLSEVNSIQLVACIGGGRSAPQSLVPPFRVTSTSQLGDDDYRTQIDSKPPRDTNGIYITPGGDTMYTWAAGLSVCAINRSTKLVIGMIPGLVYPAGASTLPDGRIMLFDSEYAFELNITNWTVTQRAETRIYTSSYYNSRDSPPPSRIAVAGSQIYIIAFTGSGGGQYVSIVNTSDWSVTKIVAESGQKFYTLVASPAGDRVYLSTMEQDGYVCYIRTIDTSTNSFIGEPISVPDHANGGVVSASGDKLYLTMNSRLIEINISTRALTSLHDVWPSHPTLSPDDNWLYFINGGDAYALNTQTHTIYGPLHGDLGTIRAIALADNGQTLYLGSSIPGLYELQLELPSE